MMYAQYWIPVSPPPPSKHITIYFLVMPGKYDESNLKEQQFRVISGGTKILVTT